MTQQAPPKSLRERVQQRTAVTAQAFKDFWIGYLLVALCLTWGSVAALYFEYSDHAFITALLLQAAGVFLALALAYIFFEQRTQKRQRKIDNAIRRSAEERREFASSAVITTTGDIFGKPISHKNYGPSNREATYQEARQITLEPHSKNGSDRFNQFPSHRRISELQWVFRGFKELATRCEQTIRLFGPALVQYDGLLRSMVRFEGYVKNEELIGRTFRIRHLSESGRSPPGRK